MTDRQAAALAAALSDTTAVPPEIARLQGIALAGVFQIIISESGRRAREGQSQAEIADGGSGEADLLRLQGGVTEGGNDDELVAVPLGCLAELDSNALPVGWIAVPSGRTISR